MPVCRRSARSLVKRCRHWITAAAWSPCLSRYSSPQPAMGSISPYYRRQRPPPQAEAAFLRDVSLRWLIQRLKARSDLPPTPINRLTRALMPAFPPATKGSCRGLLANMLIRSAVCPHIDLGNAHLDSFGVTDPVTAARDQFDNRAAAAVFARVSPHLGVRVAPEIRWMRSGVL